MTSRQQSACSGKCRAEVSRLKRKAEALAAVRRKEAAIDQELARAEAAIGRARERLKTRVREKT